MTGHKNPIVKHNLSTDALNSDLSMKSSQFTWFELLLRKWSIEPQIWVNGWTVASKFLIIIIFILPLDGTKNGELWKRRRGENAAASFYVV